MNCVRSFALLFLLLSILRTVAVGQSVTIVSPASGRIVHSPVRVVADFSGTGTVASTLVSVDNVETPGDSVTPLDMSIPISEGEHLLTVTALQSNGASVSSSRWVTVSATPSAIQSSVTAGMNATTSTIRTYPNIEEMTGWYLYPDLGHPICSGTPSPTANPSLDGASGKFYLGPTGQYNNCLWPILLGSGMSLSHFQLDAYYQISNPAYSQGVEFSSNYHVGTAWYKFSVQCSYGKGIFSVWDTAGARWSPTSIPCKRQASKSWDHLTVNTAISGGKAVFISLALNGVQYPINKSFYPTTKSSSSSFGVHFQMNGNLAGNPYYTWVDKLNFKAW